MIQEENDSEVIAINYWKEVRKDLSKILFSFWNSLLLIHNSLEFAYLLKFLNRLPYTGKIVYISLTKTYDSIYPYFDRVDAQFHVVDCVSSQLFEQKNTEDCTFEYPPENFTEITRLIEKNLKKINPDFIILDSLSQFIDFSSVSMSDSMELHDFFIYLNTKRGSTPCRFILIYDESISNKFKQFPSFFIDIILKIEVKKGRIFWS